MANPDVQLVDSRPVPQDPSKDALVQRTIADWKTLANGGALEAFQHDLAELSQRDNGPNQPDTKYGQDMGAINDALKKQNLLPNLEIYGTKGGLIIVEDQSRNGQFAALTKDKGMTEIVDVTSMVSPDGVPQLKQRANSSEPSLGTITPDAVQQGVDVPDCRLQAALASLAQADPEAITKMIKDNHDGTYTVTFPGDKDHPQTISAPTDWERSTFSKGGNDGQWALIIDKAYRQKIGQPFGPYGAAPDIEGLLTGQEHSFLYMDPDGLCNPLFRGFDWLASKLGAQSVCANNTPDIPLPQLVERNNDGAIFEDPAKVGAILQDALKNHMLITTGFKAEETKAADKVNYGTDKNGDHVEIESGHAYTVTAYDPVKQTVTLRNPWGTNIDARFPILEGDGYVTMPVDQFRRMILGLQVERTSRSTK